MTDPVRCMADYSHGVSPKSLDFHENREHAPQYRGEYSTNLFVRKAVELIREKTTDVSSVWGLERSSTWPRRRSTRLWTRLQGIGLGAHT